MRTIGEMVSEIMGKNEADILEEDEIEKKLAFASVLIGEILTDQREIDSLQKTAKYEKEFQIAKIDKSLAESTEKIQSRIDEKKAIIQPIIREYLQGKKKKSVKLSSGTAGFKGGGVVFAIANYGVYPAETCAKLDGKSPRLLEIVQQHGLNDYVRTKEVSTVDWTQFKKSLNVTDEGKVITAEGEILPELTARIEPDRFYVKAATTPEGGGEVEKN